MTTTTQQAIFVRWASDEDIPDIISISSSATKKFGSIPELADLAGSDETPEKVHEWLTKGRIYVADVDGVAAGFIAAHPMDDTLYIAEISTSAAYQGRGVGGALINAVFGWATERATQEGSRTARVSLTTYADVPWNGPWYRKHGFKEVEAEAIGPLHVAKMTRDQEERDLVRPGYRRCCMFWEKKTGEEG